MTLGSAHTRSFDAAFAFTSHSSVGEWDSLDVLDCRHPGGEPDDDPIRPSAPLDLRTTPGTQCLPERRAGRDFVGIGAAGYQEFVGLGWLDSVLNASMILTGMSPLAPFPTAPAKLFGIFYSLFSGVAFLSFAAVLLGPVAHRFLHRFHLDLCDGEADR